MRICASLEDFYNAAPKRRWSGEADYRVHWKLDGWPGAWRVSYIEETGEVYAVYKNSNNSPLIVMTTIKPDQSAGPQDTYYRTLDRILEGWAEQCPKHGSLNWLRDRLARHAKTESEK